jgi:hypothetical protein
MELSPERQAAMAEHRRRYEALKAEGTGGSALSLPPPTTIDGAPIAALDVISDETIPGGWYTSLSLKRGEALRLVDLDGTSTAAFFAWSAADPSERLNPADTIKIQWTAKLGKGRILFSDMGRALVSIVEDTTDGAHDALAGGSNAASTLARYGVGAFRNTRDNLVLAATKLGLSRRDLSTLVSFFAPVGVRDGGDFVWSAAAKTPGAFVDLRAEMDLLVALSFAPHPLDPSLTYSPGRIRLVRHRLPEAGPDDCCRTATAEAARAFDNLRTHLA